MYRILFLLFAACLLSGCASTLKKKPIYITQEYRYSETEERHVVVQKMVLPYSLFDGARLRVEEDDWVPTSEK